PPGRYGHFRYSFSPFTLRFLRSQLYYRTATGGVLMRVRRLVIQIHFPVRFAKAFFHALAEGIASDAADGVIGRAPVTPPGFPRGAVQKVPIGAGQRIAARLVLLRDGKMFFLQGFGMKLAKDFPRVASVRGQDRNGTVIAAHANTFGIFDGVRVARERADMG